MNLIDYNVVIIIGRNVDILIAVVDCGDPDINLANAEKGTVTGTTYQETVSSTCLTGHEYSDGDRQKKTTCTEEGWDPVLSEGCEGTSIFPLQIDYSHAMVRVQCNQLSIVSCL